MPKKSKLIDAVKSLEPVTNKRNWAVVLKRENPERYAELVEVVDDWIAQGRTYQVFPSMRSLHKWLSGKDQDRPIGEPVVTVDSGSFTKFVNSREASRAKKS